MKKGKKPTILTLKGLLIYTLFFQYLQRQSQKYQQLIRFIQLQQFLVYIFTLGSLMLKWHLYFWPVAEQTIIKGHSLFKMKRKGDQCFLMMLQILIISKRGFFNCDFTFWFLQLTLMTMLRVAGQSKLRYRITLQHAQIHHSFCTKTY